MMPSEIEQIRQLFGMRGWSEVLAPQMEKRLKVVQDLALLLPSERPKPYDGMEDRDATNILRGEAKGIQWCLHAFTNQVSVYDQNRRREEQRQKPNGTDAGANIPQPPLR